MILLSVRSELFDSANIQRIRIQRLEQLTGEHFVLKSQVLDIRGWRANIVQTQQDKKNTAVYGNPLT